MLNASLTGFGTGFSLILAIGAQNSFVLRQGLMRTHVFWVCLICALSDAVLIAAGVAGASGLSAAAPWAIAALTWGGAAFLAVYGTLSLGRAFHPGALRAADQGTGSLRAALLTCLALTWRNPHVYLDTVGLIGAVSTGFPTGRASSPMAAAPRSPASSSFSASATAPACSSRSLPGPAPGRSSMWRSPW